MAELNRELPKMKIRIIYGPEADSVYISIMYLDSIERRRFTPPTARQRAALPALITRLGNVDVAEFFVENNTLVEIGESRIDSQANTNPNFANISWQIGAGVQAQCLIYRRPGITDQCDELRDTPINDARYGFPDSHVKAFVMDGLYYSSRERGRAATVRWEIRKLRDIPKNKDMESKTRAVMNQLKIMMKGLDAMKLPERITKLTRAGGALVTKDLAKFGGKEFAKEIPVLGFLIGAVLAGKRMYEGDYDGATLEFTSGVLSTMPGYGTAASLAIDAGLLVRDLYDSGGATLHIEDGVGAPNYENYFSYNKSINSKIPYKVGFKNGTNREVQVIWIDFSGKEIVYKKNLKPRETYKLQKTYTTHPWIFRNAATGKRLHASFRGIKIPVFLGDDFGVTANEDLAVDIIQV